MINKNISFLQITQLCTLSIFRVMNGNVMKWFLFIGLSFIWGSSFILMKEGLEGLHAFQVASLRIVASGLVLDKLIPGLIYERSTMQWANMIHGVATVLMMAMFIGHIYMGTIGMQGAYKAMREGYVDETWAKEHHQLWYDDIQAGKIPAQRTAPASASAGTSPASAQA
jgi:drug/metabolite transporter (DMT)-like permease